jgi:hypothetical protein
MIGWRVLTDAAKCMLSCLTSVAVDTTGVTVTALSFVAGVRTVAVAVTGI